MNNYVQIDIICRASHSKKAAEVGGKGFKSAGVLEVVENDEGGTYRAVYTVKLTDWVYVLHCFQKKSMKGIETPKADIELIRARLKQAEADHAAWLAQLKEVKK